MFNLEKYIYRKRITRKSFGAMCKISQPTVRLIERGIPVSRSVAKKVAPIVGCSIGSLVNPRCK